MGILEFWRYDGKILKFINSKGGGSGGSDQPTFSWVQKEVLYRFPGAKTQGEAYHRSSHLGAENHAQPQA